RGHSMCLFVPHRIVKIQPFSPVFPLAESLVKAFCRLFLWNFKEKASTASYGTALQESRHQPFPMAQPFQ
ncbi:hypothetical protein, partial [uncultured Bilophila sp.]|uniref:hypothetical protein n=1 Tax=uncultured Bilophila sp. TaxID=529385 RepID=UPI00280A6A57